MSVSEKYGDCFKNQCLEDIIVEETNLKERKILREFMNDGNSFVEVELLDESNEKLLSLTIKDKKENIIGSINIFEESDGTHLEVMYWIKKRVSWQRICFFSYILCDI